jgi:hypothetical protein
MREQHFKAQGANGHLDGPEPGYCLYVGGARVTRKTGGRDMISISLSMEFLYLFICLFMYVPIFLFYLGWGFCLAGASPAVPFLLEMAAVHPAAMLVKKDRLRS